jgi:hypothetical protein
MIFSNRQRGQGAFEALVIMVIMILILIPTMLIFLQALASVILTKWASRNSHCIAQQREPSTCASETAHSLKKNFAFKHVNIKVRKFHGIIHSEIDAKLLSQTIKGNYDLEPSEYKRVQ